MISVILMRNYPDNNDLNTLQIAALCSSCVDQVLDFPFAIDSDQLKGIYPAITEFIFVIKLVRRPNNC
jgi:hypothetical protein